MRHYPSELVDLRSDTVTQPTPEMREAMAKASVGDDVLGDDPTVIELQEMVADIFGKEEALFVPSGTMSNAIAIRAQTEPGDEIITERYSHIYIYEGGGYAALSGCSIALVPGEGGIMDPADVEASIRKGDGSLGHYPNGSMVCVENTSNRGGGTCYSEEKLDGIAKIARENNCRSHIDGARIFNASISTDAFHIPLVITNFKFGSLFINSFGNGVLSLIRHKMSYLDSIFDKISFFPINSLYTSSSILSLSLSQFAKSRETFW